MSEINLTAVVCGGIFGGLFVLTCILSAIKAVKDRKKIKTRIAERERKKSSTNDNKNLDSWEESTHEFCSIEEGHNTDSDYGYNHYGAKTCGTHTNFNAKYNVHFSNNADTIISASNSFELNMTSGDNDIPFQVKLSPQCLAMKKQIRRSSYALAMDRDIFKNEMCTNCSGVEFTAFENKAFDSDLHGV